MLIFGSMKDAKDAAEKEEVMLDGRRISLYLPRGGEINYIWGRKEFENKLREKEDKKKGKIIA